MIDVGEKEIARREEFEKKLDYISRQLELLQDVSRLPEANMKSAPIVNRATDVFSAVLLYTAANVRHKSQFHWLTGKY